MKSFKRFIVIITREYMGKNKNYTQFATSVFLDGEYYYNLVISNGCGYEAMEASIDRLAQLGRIPSRIKTEKTTETFYGYCKRTNTMLHNERIKVTREKDLKSTEGWTLASIVFIKKEGR